MFEYFHGVEAERFSFYRVPKILFTDEFFRTLSTEAKVLYGILLDRASLSQKNGWLDDKNRVYIIYTVGEIMEDMNCGNKKAIQLLTDLEEKAGLIERKRQGLGKPNLIYVKNFSTSDEGSVEKHFLKCRNDKSGSVNLTNPEVLESHSNNTESNYTDYSDTYPFLSDDDGMRERREYEEYFRNQLELDYLIKENPTDEKTIEGIAALLVDTCCSKKKFIRIAGDDKPAEAVKSRFMNLDSEHIEYVLLCLKKNNTKVRNMRQYMLAALYNAPDTIDPFYQSWVNSDMAAGNF